LVIDLAPAERRQLRAVTAKHALAAPEREETTDIVSRFSISGDAVPVH
jgi:hypothetical protein